MGQFGSIKWLAIGACLSAAPSPGAETDRYPPSSVLLFVASWCAPCHAELDRLPAITRSARPFRVLVVPFDDSAATRAMMQAVPPEQSWQPDQRTRRRLMRVVMGETAGLPFSMAVDGEGRACGSFRRGLDGQTTAALIARCAR